VEGRRGCRRNKKEEKKKAEGGVLEAIGVGEEKKRQKQTKRRDAVVIGLLLWLFKVWQD
jgi:hypothetical protein